MQTEILDQKNDGIGELNANLWTNKIQNDKYRDLKAKDEKEFYNCR